MNKYAYTANVTLVLVHSYGSDTGFLFFYFVQIEK